MNNTDKLLRAFIEASGYEIEEADTSVKLYKIDDVDLEGDPYDNAMPTVISSIDYKVTKRKFNSKPTLHKIIREYENEGMSASEMIGRIMLLEGISNEDL